MRLLVLTHRLPYAPNRGDRIRAYHLLRVLGGQYEVHLVSLTHDASEAAHVADLREQNIVASVTVARVNRPRQLFAAALALPGAKPLTHVLLHSQAIQPILQNFMAGPRPDVVLAYGTGMARYAFEPPLDGLPCLLDMVDVDSEKWAVMATAARQPLRSVYTREAVRLRAFERLAVARACATTVVNERERALLESLFPQCGAVSVPNGVDVASFQPATPPAAASNVVFCGVFNYGPNAESAVWLATRVWPLVTEAVPDARLTLVGANPTKAVLALRGMPSIQVTGSVPDVRPFLWGASVSVAPLRVARGVQNKVLEAIAAGLPCVVTPQVFAGLPACAQSACRTAAEPGDFAREIIALLKMPPQRRREVAVAADLTELRWATQLKPMLSLVSACAVERTRSKIPQLEV